MWRKREQINENERPKVNFENDTNTYKKEQPSA